MEELLCFIYHRSNTNLSDGVRITLDKNNVFKFVSRGDSGNREVDQCLHSTKK